MTNKQAEKLVEKTIALDTLSGIARKIAEYNIRVNGVYYCVIGGVHTKVVK